MHSKLKSEKMFWFFFQIGSNWVFSRVKVWFVSLTFLSYLGHKYSKIEFFINEQIFFIFSPHCAIPPKKSYDCCINGVFFAANLHFLTRISNHTWVKSRTKPSSWWAYSNSNNNETLFTSEAYTYVDVGCGTKWVKTIFFFVEDKMAQVFVI